MGPALDTHLAPWLEGSGGGFMEKRQEIELERRDRKEVVGEKVRGKMKRDRKGEGEKKSKKERSTDGEAEKQINL